MIFDIPLVEVQSSVFLAIGYDYISQTLRVIFKSGTEYRYMGVPIQVYQDFCNAESMGAEFNRNIKNRYDSSVVQVLRVARRA